MLICTLSTISLKSDFIIAVMILTSLNIMIMIFSYVISFPEFFFDEKLLPSPNDFTVIILFNGQKRDNVFLDFKCTMSSLTNIV